MKEYVGIYIKTGKAQEQDWDGALHKIKYHFHIKHHFHLTSIVSLCFAFTLAIYTCVGLLCGSVELCNSEYYII